MKGAERLVVTALFVTSGVAALVYQVAWMRQLTLLFGGTVYAVSTILACFMGGLAAGAALAGRFAWRLERPARAYGYLELGIAAAGAVSLPAFGLVHRIVAAAVPRDLTGTGDIAIRFALALPILLVPTVLMGATLPVLSRHVARADDTAARHVGFLYTCNTLGAAGGAALAGYLLVPLLGLKATVSTAVLLNAAVGLAAVALLPGRRSDVEEAASERPTSPALGRGWLAFAFATGLSGLALEVLWTRSLVLYLGSSIYTYAAMLTVYLLGLGAGGALAVHLLGRRARPVVLLALSQALLALDLPVLVWQFQRLSAHLTALQRLVGTGTYTGFAVASFVALVEMLLPPTLLMGIAFPSLVAVRTASARSAPRDVGLLYGANTVGCIAGAIATPLLLVPWLGIQSSMALLAILALVLYLAALGAAGLPPSRWLSLGGIPPALFAAAYLLGCPKDAVVVSAGVFQAAAEPRRLVHVLEDVDATVTVEDVLPKPGLPGTGWLSLSVNGVNVAGTSPDLMAIQKLQGHLPLLLVGERGRVAHIGFGSGGTAWAVSRHPVKEMVIAELSMGVLATSHAFLRHVNHGVLDDPRVREVHKDGRNYLLAQGPPFDVILSDSVHPRYAGNGALYTEEYYRRCRSQLRPGGVVSQWLPIYSLTPSNLLSILRSFHAVFPHTSVWYVNSTVNAFTIVVGHESPLRLDAGEIARRLAEPDVARDLGDVGATDVVALLDYFVAGGDVVGRLSAGAPPHVDDLPSVEYDSMYVVNREAAWLQCFEMIRRSREPVLPYVDGADPALREKLEVAYRATTYNLEGQSLAIQGRREESARAFAKAWEINPADREPHGF